jgi:hypothetical protein
MVENVERIEILKSLNSLKVETGRRTTNINLLPFHIPT